MESKSIDTNISILNLNNQEIIDIYKNLITHYRKADFNINFHSINNSNSYFDSYILKIESELKNRGLEIVHTHNDFEIILNENCFDFTKNNLNNNLEFEKSIVQSISEINNITKSNSTKATKSRKIKKIFEVEGDSMINYGIYSGDLVYCSSFQHKRKGKILSFDEIGELINEKLIVAKLKNGLFIKKAEYNFANIFDNSLTNATNINNNQNSIKNKTSYIILKSYNPKYYNFKITEYNNFRVLGIVEKITRIY